MKRRETKQQHCPAHEVEGAGAMWDHTAVAADSKRGVHRGVGQRPQEQTRALVRDVRRPLRPGHFPAICTEADAGYAPALCEAFGRRYPAPAMAPQAGPRVPSCAGRQEWPRGRGKNRIRGVGVSE
jgi:hypothetical protein